MASRDWALIATVAIMVGACGAPPAAAASTPKPKPSAAPSIIATPRPWLQPFEDVWFLNANEGWAVILTGADHAVETIRSLDGGVSWSAAAKVTSLFVPEGDAPPRIGVRFTNPQVGWVFGPGIYATSDGGQTWTETLAGTSVSDIATFGARGRSLDATSAWRRHARRRSWFGIQPRAAGTRPRTNRP